VSHPPEKSKINQFPQEPDDDQLRQAVRDAAVECLAKAGAEAGREQEIEVLIAALEAWLTETED